MKQAADGKVFAKLVESLHGGHGLQDFGFDAFFRPGLARSRARPDAVATCRTKAPLRLRHGRSVRRGRRVECRAHGGFRSRSSPLAGAAGKHLASLKGEKPSTSMRPQARCTMRGDFGSAWPISASGNKKGKPGHCDRSFPRNALSLVFFARIDRRRAHESGNSRARLRQAKISSGCCPNITPAPGSELCSRIANAVAGDVSPASPFHVMVPSRFASRRVREMKGNKA